MTKILYKLASREREKRLFATIDNILSMSRHNDFEILCSFDNDDVAYNNEPFRERINAYPKVIYRFGDNKSKIQAINADVDVVQDWHILVNLSDDQEVIMEGFDLDIIETFKYHFPDLNGAVHYPEQYSKATTIVLSIMGRKMYESFGYIFNPIYYSQYCDDEFTQIVRMTNRYWFRPIKIFRHIHPAFDHTLPKDALYMRNMNLNMQAIDNQLYIQRRDNNFGLY